MAAQPLRLLEGMLLLSALYRWAGMPLKKLTPGIILAFTLIPFFIISANADSSWIWVSETRPYDLLPFVILGTLLVETVGIALVSRVKRTIRVFYSVFFGNFISFGLTNLLLLSDKIYTFTKSLTSLPIYIASISFVILTLVIEAPVEFLLLKRDAANKKILLFAIILFNFITTVAVAIVERTLCHGYWV